jgi:hypothetical protein
MNSVIDLQTCPRCEFNSLEFLKDSVSCYNCNYCPDLDPVQNFEVDRNSQIPQWAIEALNDMTSYGKRSDARKRLTVTPEEKGKQEPEEIVA